MRIIDIKLKTGLIIIGICIIAIPLLWLLSSRLEGTNPTVTLEPAALSLGASREITITAADAKTGLRKAQVALLGQLRRKGS